MLDVPCEHEQTMKPPATFIDCLRWYEAAQCGESSWLAWAFLPFFPGRVPVLHTLRNPWSVIDSLSNRNSILRKVDKVRSPKSVQSIRDTIRTYCPRVWTYENIVDRAAALVVDWNRCIKKACPGRCSYQCEALDVPTVREMLWHIGIDRDDEVIKSALSSVSKTTNEGWTVVDTPGVSDPHVAEYLEELAKQNNAQIFTRRILDDAKRNTAEELVERMDPGLLAEVNEHASLYGYATADALTGVLVG